MALNAVASGNEDNSSVLSELMLIAALYFNNPLITSEFVITHLGLQVYPHLISFFFQQLYWTWLVLMYVWP